jgi:cytochrome c oxidase assembly protein Cox11
MPVQHARKRQAKKLLMGIKGIVPMIFGKKYSHTPLYQIFCHDKGGRQSTCLPTNLFAIVTALIKIPSQYSRKRLSVCS